MTSYACCVLPTFGGRCIHANENREQEHLEKGCTCSESVGMGLEDSLLVQDKGEGEEKEEQEEDKEKEKKSVRPLKKCDFFFFLERRKNNDDKGQPPILISSTLLCC